MGVLSFIHLSDIHFVKTSGNPADIDQDLRDAIILDININAKRNINNLNGVLISGDIAFCGDKKEYEKAQDFLEKITDIFEISRSNIFCVPGNHDVDQTIPKASTNVYDAQCILDKACSLDEIDKSFESKMTDKYYNDVLFKPIQEYNEFASKFTCSINANSINWNVQFELDHEMKLIVHGMNSCFISNSDDHKTPGQNRLMYIGQAQIPYRKDNTVCMILCHHPPEDWKFMDKIIKKINKRADIQLYGHKHEQTITLTEENIIITSGATHPVRGGDWNPRYNWITIECLRLSEKRVIKVLIYPRILDEHRDRFIPDTQLCDGKIYLEHYLPIDEKRKNDLLDTINFMDIKENNPHKETMGNIEDSINQRELIYKFFDLSYIRQTEILMELMLLDEDDAGKRYSSIISKIIYKVKRNNLMKEFWGKINN